MTTPPNPAYTFEAFVVSAKSKEAWSASVAVANNPGRAYNPLLLHGRSGSGKSHLLHAIVHAMRSRRPAANILRVPAATFASSLVDAIRHDELEAFERSLAATDALLLDDFRLLADKPRTEEEVLRQLEELAARGVQVVITFDGSQTYIRRLRSRLKDAHEAEVGYPDGAARAEIARGMAARQGMTLPEDVMRDIAEQLTGSPARLRSMIMRIAAEMNVSA